MRQPKARDTVISTNTQEFIAAGSGLESHPPNSMSRRLEMHLERFLGASVNFPGTVLPWKLTWSTPPLAAYSPTVLTRNVALVHSRSFLSPTGS